MDHFPSINENNRQKALFECHIPNVNNLTNVTPRFNSKTKTNPTFNHDCKSDTSEHIDIEEDSIGLALSILCMSKSEYNRISINQLKELRKIDCNNRDIYAINILIYYKQNSKNLLFPETNPIQHIPIKVKFNQYMNDKVHSKIYPEID